MVASQGHVGRVWYGRTGIGAKDTSGGVLVWAEDEWRSPTGDSVEGAACRRYGSEF